MQGVRQQEGERVHENSTPDRNDRDGPDCGYRDRGDEQRTLPWSGPTHRPSRRQNRPTKPRGLEATATYGRVVLSWNDPGDDSITSYVILRRVRVNDTGGDFDVLVANTASAATGYTDATVAAGLTYTYRIKAINEHGVSERSRWVHIDTPAAPVPDKPRASKPRRPMTR